VILLLISEGKTPDYLVTGVPTEIAETNPKLKREFGQTFKQKFSCLIIYKQVT
jgi:hypothetical protein